MILPFPEPPASNVVDTSTSHPTLPSQSTTSPSAADINSILAASLIPTESQTTASPVQSPIMSGSFNKESQPIPNPQPPEITHVVEYQEEEKLPTEVEGYLQKLDQAGDIKLKEPITHDGEVLLANSDAQVIRERIVLPMSQSAVQQGKKSSVNNSGRWLAEWCIRLIKMMKDKVKYAEEGQSIT